MAMFGLGNLVSAAHAALSTLVPPPQPQQQQQQQQAPVPVEENIGFNSSGRRARTRRGAGATMRDAVAILPPAHLVADQHHVNTEQVLAAVSVL